MELGNLTRDSKEKIEMSDLGFEPVFPFMLRGFKILYMYKKGL